MAAVPLGIFVVKFDDEFVTVLHRLSQHLPRALLFARGIVIEVAHGRLDFFGASFFGRVCVFGLRGRFDGLIHRQPFDSSFRFFAISETPLVAIRNFFSKRLKSRHFRLFSDLLAFFLLKRDRFQFDSQQFFCQWTKSLQRSLKMERAMAMLETFTRFQGQGRRQCL